jgi:hypothetical protein
MKQYDKIWVPEKKQGMAFRDAYGDTLSIVTGPVIVLTIEELRGVWEAAWNEGYNDSSISEGRTNIEPLPDFTAYLKSQGITL